MKGKIISGVFASLLAVLISAPSARCDAPASLDVTAMDCTVCHEQESKSLTNSAMHASVHAKLGIGKCTVCHDAKALTESHKNVKPGKPKFVKTRRYPKEFCLRCHGTYADLAKRTANSKALMDDKGRVFNPHDLPKPPKHSDKMDECTNCHKEHKKNPSVVQNCVGCHHTGEFINCNKCHDS